MENRSDSENQKQKETPFVVKIPSYEEVVEGSQPKPQSLFDPSPSFSQAFNFVKNSEFYSTPPPAPPPQPSHSHGTHTRQFVQPDVPSTSVSSAGANRNAILVSNRQKGNPLLKHIRNVRWVFADIVCDFLVGQNSCALYLSLRYHLLHPDYLYFRIRELQKNFKLRVVLCHVDVEDVIKPLLEVTKTALLHDCTLLCGWRFICFLERGGPGILGKVLEKNTSLCLHNLEECGRYLETIKVYENKSADLIQGQMDMDYISRLNNALTSVRHVNKTDVVTLGSTFGSLSNIMDASMEDLARCPGIGERKVKRLHDTFHEPFKRSVPSQAPVPANAGQSERNEDVEEIQDASKRQKKEKEEKEVSVKSALKVAFAKYSGKLGRKGSNVVQGQTSAQDQQVNSDEDFAT